MTAAEQIAEWATQADLAGATTARTAVVDALIDTVGCIHAGWRDPVAAKALNVAQGWGIGDASVLTQDIRLSPPRPPSSTAPPPTRSIMTTTR